MKRGWASPVSIEPAAEVAAVETPPPRLSRCAWRQPGMGSSENRCSETGAQPNGARRIDLDKTVVGKSAADAAPEANVGGRSNAEQAVADAKTETIAAAANAPRMGGRERCLTAEKHRWPLDAEMQRAHAKPVAAAAEPEGSMLRVQCMTRPTSSHTVVAQHKKRAQFREYRRLRRLHQRAAQLISAVSIRIWGSTGATPAPAEALPLRLPLQNPSLSPCPLPKPHWHGRTGSTSVIR